jgi:hypothetical protein
MDECHRRVVQDVYVVDEQGHRSALAAGEERGRHRPEDVGALDARLDRWDERGERTERQ